MTIRLLHARTIRRESQNRNVNAITGILGNVYGSTWLSETIVNVSGTDGHSNGQEIIQAPISVPIIRCRNPGMVRELDFDGEPVFQLKLSSHHPQKRFPFNPMLP